MFWHFHRFIFWELIEERSRCFLYELEQILGVSNSL